MRLSKQDKGKLLLALVDAALARLDEAGKPTPVHVGDTVKQATGFERGHFMLLHTTPAANLPGAPAAYGLDVYWDHDKHLSVWWDQLGDFHTVIFKYGEWMGELIPGSYTG